MYKPVIVKADPVKERLKELKTKPILTIPELTEAVKKLIDLTSLNSI